MADQEGIQTRLNNIRSVEPILEAMRTISLGSWQAALSRHHRLGRYSERLAGILAALSPRLGGNRSAYRQPRPASIEALVIGSERGLCGAFNSSLIQFAAPVLDGYAESGQAVRLAVLGSRAQRSLERIGRSPDAFRPLPMTAVPSVELANELTLDWLRRYEAREIDAVYVIYHAYIDSRRYEPSATRLIPPSLPAQFGAASTSGPTLAWPPPYVDADPVDLYRRLARLWTVSEMYRILLSSTAAEHSTRYQLMEGATQNTQRLTQELTLALQSVRQRAITAEMLDLVAGAGMLGGQEA
jgi:F-type H+-transporting ATPase subunit gamma